MRAIYVLAVVAMTATAYAVELDLSAFDGEPIKATATVDLSAFDAPPISLQAFDAVPHVDLSAFDEPQTPAVKPSQRALDYPQRSNNWTHPGTDKAGLINHLMTHPNHGGKFDSTMLLGLDYRELESLHSDDHEGRVKPVQVAAIKSSSPPAAVTCPNGSCPVRADSPRTTANTGMKPATATPQPVYYYTGNWCPTGNCPTPQRTGLFSGLRLKGR